MKLKNNEVSLKGREGIITIKRSEHGIPEICGQSRRDLSLGLGWVHACDRQLQVLLTKILVQGRAAELLQGSQDLVEIDRFMRRMNLLPDLEREVSRLKPSIKDEIQAYINGFNHYLAEEGPITEFKLLRYRPDPLEMKDVLIMAKIMGFIGLADAQGNMEKFIVQMVQKDVNEKKIKELFPYIKEKIDYELIKKVRLAPPVVPESVKWMGSIPKFAASNNWVVSGKRSSSGLPILCGDPHLEVNRLPSIWYEIVSRLPDNYMTGATLPGVPGLIIGRTKHLAWSPTFAFMDMIDYRIEECRNGMYRRGKQWKKFMVRDETIMVKKGSPVVEKVYENEHGILEGDPHVDGHYLVMSYSGARDCCAGDFNGLAGLYSAKNAKEAMSLLRQVGAGAWCFVVADSRGNIGYQMTGKMYNRPGSVSGLVPLPGWEKKYNPRGFVDPKNLPSLYNPRDGFIVTANNDLNHLGRAKPINLPMAPYRSDRITQRIREKKSLSVNDMKSMHYDLYSLQADRIMSVIRPLLPDSKKGNLLRDWDCTYHEASEAAMLFESVYLAILKKIFGDRGIGRDVIDHIMKETALFADYYGNFDAIIMKKKSAWFSEEEKEKLIRQAIDEGLSVRVRPYGKTRRVTIAHLLFGGKLPRFLGFDYGPISLPGSRATIPQGQIFSSAGRITTYSPSYRMIADMSTDELHSNLAGGVSDRRFSEWYVSDFKNWLTGIYKVLR